MLKFKTILGSILLVSASLVISAQSGQPNQKAAKYLSEGRFQDAITELDKDIGKEKNLYQNLKFRGLVRSMTGNFRGAFDDYTKALEIDSSDGSIYEQRASVRLFLGQDTSEILPDLDLAISRGVKTQKVYSRRGMMRLLMRDAVGAIADYEIAVGLDPGNAGANLGLANAYDSKGDTEKAILILENFFLQLENSGEQPEMIKREVVARTQIKDIPVTNKGDGRIGVDTIILKSSEPEIDDEGGPPTQEKMDRMSAKMEQKRNIPMAYTTLARLYKKQGLYEKGLDATNKSMNLDPNDFYTLEMRGTIKAKLGDLSGGLADFNKALEINPRPQSAIYLERGIVYLMMDDKVNSQKDFDKYLESFPNGKPYLEKRIKEVTPELSETSIGVAACDDYLFKVRRCLYSKVPEASNVAFERSMQSTQKAWRSAASTPEGRAGLEAGCRTALETMKVSLSSYKCEW